MKKRLYTFIFTLFLSLPFFFMTATQAQNLNIIPAPQSAAVGKGHFKISPQTGVCAKGKGAKNVQKLFIDKFKKASDIALAMGKSKHGGNIVFEISDTAPEGKESYSIEIDNHGVTAQARTETGLFYAAQTLLQMLPAEIENTYENNQSRGNIEWKLPFAKITDSPRFAYRGVMLDPCRHFIPVQSMKEQIERLSAYKINRLHWHLTDDQGWRIEIKKYPGLTRTGAYRTEEDGSNYGGYYTQEEVKEIVEYAQKHHIEIIPELEMPGHEMAAIAAYPWLTCHEREVKPRIIWGVEDVVLCPGRESTFAFLQDVIDEMAPLFPGSLFHIGGDECPREQWTTCDKCQARMKQLSYTTPAQLQSYTVKRIGNYLKTKGKTLIGWDEISEGGDLDTTAIVMSWRGEKGGIQAAGMGHKVIMTPSSHGLYFDQYQGDYVTEPTTIGGYSPIQKVYSYDPVPKTLKENGKSANIIGVQANCWSEYMLTTDLMEYRLYPRALALAEIAWTQPEHKDFKDFCRRLDNDAALRLKYRHVNFHIPFPEQAEGCNNNIAFSDKYELRLNTTRPLGIVYTTDGTSPSEKSERYTAPLTFSQTSILKTRTLLPNGLMGPIRTINITKMPYWPARKDLAEKEYKISLYNGRYNNPYLLPEKPDTILTANSISVIRGLRKLNAALCKSENYSAIAEGYIDIPENGIYEFSSDNNQVWLDGNLIIENPTTRAARFSPNKIQIALAKGQHSIKAVFLGGIWAGWPTYWNDGKVHFKKIRD